MEKAKILKLIERFSVTSRTNAYREIHRRELVKIAHDFRAFPCTEAGVLKAIRKWESEGLKTSTIKTRMSRLQVFFKLGVKQGHFKSNPVNFEFAPKINDQRAPQGLSKIEVDHLIKQVPKQTWLGQRDRLILALMITNGYRISTIAKIKWNDFYYQSGELYLNTWEKGNKLNTKRIRPDVAKMLDEYQRITFHEK